jgi:ribosomal-protein-alanine N-acetyltransferase
MIYRLNDEYSVRGLRESDLDGTYPSWFEDQDVCRFNSHGKFVRTAAYFRNYVQSLDGSDLVVWAICHASDGHIGNVSLQSLSFIDRSAEFAIIIGDRRHWRRGVGKLAAARLLEHGFLKLNLNRIYCGTVATNEGMKRLALALGMQQEGVRRAHCFLDGQWVDVLEFGVLRSEFANASNR